MTHPYKNLPEKQFWRLGVEQVERHLMDPCGSPKFTIKRQDKIISVGSCFAQVVAEVLQSKGFNYYVTERGDDLSPEERARKNYGVYSARYGNLYTPRQLLQLLQEAFEGKQPTERIWTEADGRVLDPYRPTIDPDGFASPEGMLASRSDMLSAVRDMVRNADVFVITLGGTECWRSRQDGWVFPLVPGSRGGTFDPEKHEFVNFGFVEALADMVAAFDILRRQNPELKVLLTVSPVQMMATNEDEHVLTASAYAKSVLRAVAGELSKTYDWLQYFPSYELMTGSFAAGAYFNDDTRTINDAGRAHIVRILFDNMVDASERLDEKPEVKLTQHLRKIVCDEEDLANAIEDSATQPPEPPQPQNPEGNAMPVTRDDVIWGFKMLLGRVPKSEETIQAHMGFADVDAFRTQLMTCAEFARNAPYVRAALEDARAEMGQRIPINASMNPVDVDVDPERMAQLWTRIKAAWEGMGEEYPHHSVLTNEDFLPLKFADNEERFWETGEEETSQALETLGKYSTRDTKDMICAEYGCGVGRLSVPMARHFEAYHAMDISQPHLDLAKSRAQECGRENIEFLNVTNLEAMALPSCDLFYSRIVLQHNPPPIIAQILRRAMTSLNPGGIAMFQVPVHKKNYAFSIDTYLKDTEEGLMEMHALPQNKVFEIFRNADCNVLEVREDNATESPTVFVSMTFIVQKASG